MDSLKWNGKGVGEEKELISRYSLQVRWSERFVGCAEGLCDVI